MAWLAPILLLGLMPPALAQLLPASAFRSHLLMAAPSPAPAKGLPRLITDPAVVTGNQARCDLAAGRISGDPTTAAPGTFITARTLFGQSQRAAEVFKRFAGNVHWSTMVVFDPNEGKSHAEKMLGTIWSGRKFATTAFDNDRYASVVKGVMSNYDVLLDRVRIFVVPSAHCGHDFPFDFVPGMTATPQYLVSDSLLKARHDVRWAAYLDLKRGKEGRTPYYYDIFVSDPAGQTSPFFDDDVAAVMAAATIQLAKEFDTNVTIRPSVAAAWKKGMPPEKIPFQTVRDGVLYLDDMQLYREQIADRAADGSLTTRLYGGNFLYSYTTLEQIFGGGYVGLLDAVEGRQCRVRPSGRVCQGEWRAPGTPCSCSWQQQVGTRVVPAEYDDEDDYEEPVYRAYTQSGLVEVDPEDVALLRMVRTR